MNLSLFGIIEEMVVAARVRMIQVDVEDIVAYEAACDERIWKIIDWHREVVEV